MGSAVASTKLTRKGCCGTDNRVRTGHERRYFTRQYKIENVYLSALDISRSGTDTSQPLLQTTAAENDDEIFASNLIALFYFVRKCYDCFLSLLDLLPKNTLKSPIKILCAQKS